MLKLTAGQLKDSINALAQLAQQRISNSRLAYNLGKTYKAFKAELENIDEIESRLYKDFGATETVLPNGQTVLQLPDDITAEQRETVKTRLKEIKALEVEIWGNSINLDEIEQHHLNLSPSDYAALDWLIAEPQQPEKSVAAAA
jgi:uncharacterized lipoprotein YddW (UPF0748 family)